MMRPRATTRRVVRLPSLAIVAMVMTCLVATVDGRQGRWFELYDQAVAHVAKGEWAQAEQKLVQARKLGPRPGRAVLRYGTVRESFFPDYYLGVVYLNTDRPRDAAKQFEIASGQSPDPRDREFAQLQTQLARALQQVKALDTPPQPTPTPTVAARNPAGSGEKPPGSGEKPGSGSKPVGTENPIVTPPAAPPSQPPAAVAQPDARAQLDQVLKSARTQLTAGNTAGARTTIEEGRRLGLDATRLNEVEREVRREEIARDVRRAVETRNLATASASLSKLESIDAAWATTAELRAQVGTLRATLQRLSSERRAMVAFFAGNYEQTLTLLNETERSGALSPRGYFYRACSLAALALVANPRDTAKLGEARRQYGLAAARVGELARDRRYISPEILKVLAGS